MKFGDAGSSWGKLFTAGDDSVKIVPTMELAAGDLRFDWGTGHTARNRSKRFENDLIALSSGALASVDDDDFTVLDLGSRDAKLVAFAGRRPVKLDWSVGCASATGATLEMLGKFYNIDWDGIEVEDKWTPVTCGTYAIERIMDQVSAGGSAQKAIGRFVHGLARNCFDFSGKPEKLYLSGGFTLNRPFAEVLRRYTEVVLMGRTVPLAGLWSLAREENPEIGEIPKALLEKTTE